MHVRWRSNVFIWTRRALGDQTMRLGGRLQAAIEVLTEIDARHRPVPDALKDWGLSHRFAGSGDRAAISNLVHDALRMKLSHGFIMGGDSPADLAVATLLRQWRISPEELTSTLDGDRFAPEIPSTEKLADCLARDLSQAEPHVRADIPEWLVGSFERAFGNEWEAEAQAMTARPPLDLRVNTLQTDRDQVVEAFAEQGARPTRLAPNGIRIEAGEGPQRQIAATSEVSFARGWFEIQDEGSQLAAHLAGAAPGEKLLDYCAGGGGKSLAFAAMMKNEGSINAYDADRRRLAPMVERIRRAGAEIIYIKERAANLAGLEGRMDRVLIDAPCTGTGTWRRRPDAKWRISEKNIADRTLPIRTRCWKMRSTMSARAVNWPMSPARCCRKKTPTGSRHSCSVIRNLKPSASSSVGVRLWQMRMRQFPMRIRISGSCSRHGGQGPTGSTLQAFVASPARVCVRMCNDEKG
jgi:16S rRNA (cytosine967-C5)-methyltransferase